MDRTDELIEIDLGNGQARVMICETTKIAQRGADLHGCTPVCTAAMGRLMTGTLMMGMMLKGKGESVTVSIHGNGPMGTLMAVSEPGCVRACADNPRVDLPSRSDGKLDVGGAVGRKGLMTVVRDLGGGKQYIGQSELVNGEIAMDFAQYFTVSEQTNSLVALGVLVSGETVIKAGGLLIQPLPGCSEEMLDALELRSPMFADISREMTFAEIDTLWQDWFRGLDPKVLNRTPLQYLCTCSRERMEKALISLGEKELQELISEGQGAEMACHFCHNCHFFTTADLQKMLETARGGEHE